MKISKSGFTLVEILVSTMIIAMMMTSIITFVSYGGEVWQRTHFATTLAGEGQMILDSLDREMSFASSIVTPIVGAVATSTVVYRKIVFDFDRANSASCTFIIEKDLTKKRVYSIFVEGSYSPLLWTTANDPANVAKEIARSRHNYDLGRNVDSLEITRVSTNRIDVRVVLKSKRPNDEYETENVFSRSILIPSPVP